MAEEKQESLVGQEISGCEILQKVAIGGMGAVYKARHKALDRIVCVKILSPALTNDKKAVELFLTEARAIAELEHPNIVQVFNVGKERGYYFIVMSFIEGQTLSQLIKKQKGLPLSTVLDLFEGVLLGLDAAHAKGIIHRDIKPSNILINNDGQAKIVDFGIAKKVDKEKGTTKTTELAGTAYFIAPEQALGRDLDTRADLYSVGASLYYVLTGQFPYNGKNSIDIIQKHINEPIPNPAKLRPDIPAWLAGAVQKLMSKKPEDRFQTAKETYVYFQKMRAEDMLRFKKGSSISLAENTALRIVKEEKFQTTSVQQKRQTEKPLKHSTNTKPSMLPSIDAAVVRPNADPSSDPKAETEKPQEQPMLSSEKEAKEAPVYTPAPSKAEILLHQTARNSVKLTKNLLFKLPVFIVLTVAVAYVWHRLGVICSVNTIAQDGALRNLINPFLADHYAPGQLVFSLWAVIVFVLAVMSAAVKEFSQSTFGLLLLAVVSYMAGLFVPQGTFLDISNVAKYMLTPEYYLCYLVVAFVWAVALCFVYNRTLLQGLLGAALAGLVAVLAYSVPHLTLAPDSGVWTWRIVFYVAILGAFLAAFCLANPKYKTSMLLPFLGLVIAVAGMWTYEVSGMVSTIKHTTKALVANIKVDEINTAAYNAEVEQEVGLESRREVFAKLDKTTNFSLMSHQQQELFLAANLHRIAPETFDEGTEALFIRFLQKYYNGGADNMDYEIWRYALAYPVDVFSWDAQDNGAYSMAMLLLMLTSIGLCAGAIFLGEE